MTQLPSILPFGDVVLFERHCDHTALVTLNRPAARNAVNIAANAPVAVRESLRVSRAALI